MGVNGHLTPPQPLLPEASNATNISKKRLFVFWLVWFCLSFLLTLVFLTERGTEMAKGTIITPGGTPSARLEEVRDVV